MKVYSLIAAVMLGMAVLVHAQTNPASQPSEPALKLNDESGPLVTDTLSLKAGSLKEVVEQVERHFMGDSKRPGVELPNLVYAKDARDAAVLGDLTLRRVTPVQALALVAAAADCIFRPIFAPDEKPGQKTMIIGYRIEPQAASGSAKASNGRFMNTTGSPSEFSDGSSSFGGSGGGSSERRPSVQVVNPNAPGATSPGAGRAGAPKTSSANSAGMPSDNNQRFVRVYSIGFIKTATDEEAGRKMKDLEELLAQTIIQADLHDASPNHNFHVRTGTFMAKATAAQHEIIEQVIKAINENETRPVAPAKP